MSNNNNQLNIPQAREAMDRFKMQAAQEVGVNLTNADYVPPPEKHGRDVVNGGTCETLFCYSLYEHMLVYSCL